MFWTTISRHVVVIIIIIANTPTKMQRHTSKLYTLLAKNKVSDFFFFLGEIIILCNDMHINKLVTTALEYLS